MNEAPLVQLLSRSLAPSLCTPAVLVTAKREAVVAKKCGIPSLNTGSVTQLKGNICQTGTVPRAHRQQCSL